MTSRRVGFIGLGNMGGRMTRRLAEAGYEVLGYDPVAGKATAAGAIPADSVADAVTGSNCVLMSLPDSSVIEQVVLGPAGVLESCRPGQVIVDLSTAARRQNCGARPSPVWSTPTRYSRTRVR